MQTDVRIVRLNDPPPYPELEDVPKHFAEVDRVVILEGGVEDGRASVAIIIALPDGGIVFLETSARMFEHIAACVRGACQSWGEEL